MNFKKKVRALLGQAVPVSSAPFSHDQIKELPIPVIRYFKFAFAEGQEKIFRIKLFHGGQFKSSLKSAWQEIQGEQYFTTSPPGFLWRGRTTFFSALDMYINGRGRLIVYLFSFLRIINGKGPHFDQGELTRWLAESVWFPTNLLPSEKLSWSAINSTQAFLRFSHLNINLCFKVTFDITGAMLQIETERFIDKRNIRPWIVRLSDYKKIHKIKVPTKTVVAWGLKDGEFPYAKFNVTSIDYDLGDGFHEPS